MMKTMLFGRNTIIRTVIWFLILCVVIFLSSWLIVEKVIPTCDYPRLAPTIEEFGSGYIILGGNREKLTHFSYHRFGNAGVSVIRSNADEATLLYSRLTRSAGEVTIGGSSSITLCTLHVEKDNSIYTAKQRTFLPQVSEFEANWRVQNYTEYVLPSPVYRIPPNDLAGVLLKAVPITGELQTPHQINIRVSQYDTEQIAEEAFLNERPRFKAHLPSSNIEPTFELYIEGCESGPTMYFCRYLGQSGKYILEMSIGTSRNKNFQNTPSILTENWGDLIHLAESKIIQE